MKLIFFDSVPFWERSRAFIVGCRGFGTRIKFTLLFAYKLIPELKEIVRKGYDRQDPKTLKKIKGAQEAPEMQETNGIEANATDE